MEEMFSSLICFYLFFLYISFGTFFGQGIAPASQREVKQCNQNMESDILRQHSLALSPWPSKNLKFHRSSGLHPVFSYSCCMYVRVGRPAFAWSFAGVHRSTSLMSSSLLLQQCPACLVRLTCIVFVMGGRWPLVYHNSR